MHGRGLMCAFHRIFPLFSKLAMDTKELNFKSSSTTTDLMRMSRIMYLLTCIVANVFYQVSAAQNIRIMPMGDFFTVGSKNIDAAYRSGLYKGLTGQGYDIDLVGSETSDVSTELPDADHEGHDDWPVSKFTIHIHEYLDNTDPDIILLTVGGNEVTGNINNALNDLDELIAKITSLRSSTMLFVSNLTRRKNEYQDSRIETIFNPKVPDIVGKYSDEGFNVFFVDLHTALSLDDLGTNIFPTEIGYDKIGDKWVEEISSRVQVDGTGLPPRTLLRARGALDSDEVTLSFSKAMPQSKAAISNFAINGGVQVLDVQLQDRDIVLKTSKQNIETTYTVTVKSGSNGGNQKAFTVGWRMLVLSDLHQGEKYVFNTNPDENENDVKIISLMKERYGGDLILIPGDTNEGLWSTESFRQEMIDEIGYPLSHERVVLEAGKRCYQGMLNSFHRGGYWKVLVAFGDHEGGDDPWRANDMKSILQPSFRDAFAENINYDNGEFLYKEQIGATNSRPLGTDFEESSHAYIHQNTLIVTLNVLYQKNSYTEIGKAGTVTGTIEGAHLQWFKSILEEASTQPKVKFIIVQGHFPVMFPVRKVQSSGMYIDDVDHSEFLQALRDYNVNVYFAGEAHLNTVTKDSESDLIQVVSRGNYFSNFLTVDVTNSNMYIQSYNEIGEKETMYNYNYNHSGYVSLSIKSSGQSTLDSGGNLNFLDRSMPMIHFDFENMYALKDRPVLGLGEVPGVMRSPIVDSIEIESVLCDSSLPNVGAFGQNYDAQAANINLDTGVHGSAGTFDVNSRAAVLGMGPHSENKAISYSLWINTLEDGNKMLLAYEGYWVRKEVMNLRLRNGRPEISYSKSQQTRTDGDRLNDGKWHHIAVVMPHDNCLLSELLFYIDGVEVNIFIVGDDGKMNLPNEGMISVGGFGHGNVGSGGDSREGFMGGGRFTGSIDDVMIWPRSLTLEEVQHLSTFPTHFSLRSKLSYRNNEAMCLGFGLSLNEIILQQCSDSFTQQWTIDSLGYIRSRVFYQKCLAPTKESFQAGNSVQLVDCSKFDNNSLIWKMTSDGIFEYRGNSGLFLTINEGNNNVLELATESSPEVQKWDIVYEGMASSSYLTEYPTSAPSDAPTGNPSAKPSSSPTDSPTSAPTKHPTKRPTGAPSPSPSSRPSASPTKRPTMSPSVSPSKHPSSAPSVSPTHFPSAIPSIFPTISHQPSTRPSMCENRKDGFGKYATESGVYKSCAQAAKTPRLCEDPHIYEMCPVACQLDCNGYNGDCYDSIGAFSSPSGVSSECSNALSDPAYCLYPWFQDECKHTCFGSCSGCADLAVSFHSPSGVTRTCKDAEDKPNLCERDWFSSLCPASCNIECDDESTESVSEEETCKDNGDGFLNNKGIMKYCSELNDQPGFCSKPLFQANCKMSCFGSCDECADTLGVKISGKWRPCKRATSPDHALCNTAKFQRSCPKACGQCTS